jgi:hypothetical protein
VTVKSTNEIYSGMFANGLNRASELGAVQLAITKLHTNEDLSGAGDINNLRRCTNG